MRFARVHASSPAESPASGKTMVEVGNFAMSPISSCRQVMRLYRCVYIKDLVAAMHQNGEINRKFGIYKTVCCGAEIVINLGATFPDCPNHRKLSTIWKYVVDEKQP